MSMHIRSHYGYVSEAIELRKRFRILSSVLSGFLIATVVVNRSMLAVSGYLRYLNISFYLKYEFIDAYQTHNYLLEHWILLILTKYILLFIIFALTKHKIYSFHFKILKNLQDYVFPNHALPLTNLEFLLI